MKDLNYVGEKKENKSEPLRVFLEDIVDKSTKKEILEDRMRELKNLVETYG